MANSVTQTVLKLDLSERTCTNFHDFLKNEFMCDFEIEVIESKYKSRRYMKCHKLVLAAASPFVRRLLKENILTKEITLKDLPFQTVKCFVEALYFGRLIINEINILDIIHLAEYFEATEISREVITYLMSTLDETNCLWIREMISQRNVIHLIEKVEIYIKNHFSAVCQTEYFQQISFKLLETLVESNQLNVNSETEVYESVMTWVRADPSSRQEKLPVLLREIKFPLMDIDYLYHIQFREPLIKPYKVIIETIKQASEIESGCSSPSVSKKDKLKIEHFIPREATSEIVCKQLIIVGGKDVHGNFIESIETSSNNGKSWIEAGHMLKKLSHFAATKHKESIIMVGGQDENIKASSLCFKLNYFNYRKWEMLDSLPTALYSLGACCIENRVYVTGGFTGETDKVDFKGCHSAYSLDVQNKGCVWQRQKRMREARQGHIVVACNDYVYCIGGLGRKSCERYDVSKNTWSAVSRGQHRGVYLSSMEMYNPESNQWFEMESKISIPRIDFSMTSSLDALYIIGGTDEQKKKYKLVEECSPNTYYRWKAVGNPKIARAGHVLLSLTKS
ncbi:Kelch-like protein 8 [Nymphon striatum]|nr:Kelch-like protein 8 [Nymphon striatum]